VWIIIQSCMEWVKWNSVRYFRCQCYQKSHAFSCTYIIELWRTWEVWRALKKLELLTASPLATSTVSSCPNLSGASWILKHDIKNYQTKEYFNGTSHPWLTKKQVWSLKLSIPKNQKHAIVKSHFFPSGEHALDIAKQVHDQHMMATCIPLLAQSLLFTAKYARLLLFRLMVLIFTRWRIYSRTPSYWRKYSRVQRTEKLLGLRLNLWSKWQEKLWGGPPYKEVWARHCHT